MIYIQAHSHARGSVNLYSRLWCECLPGYAEHEEAYNLVQQAGVWEVHPSNDSRHGNVIRQMVTQPPIDTCRPRRMPHPVAIVGNFNW